MASETLTEYERRRLENIRRNDEMMASLKLHSKANELSSAAKRQRIVGKAYKITPEKKPKTESPIIIRRSLRARGMPPDFSTAKGLEDDLIAPAIKTPKSPSQPKPSPQNLGPLSMGDAYSGAFSDRTLIDTIMGMSKNSPFSSSIKREFSSDGVPQDPPLSFSVKKESDGDEGSHGMYMGTSETPTSSCSVKKQFDGVGDSYNLDLDVKENAKLDCLVKKESDRIRDLLDLGSLSLKPENVARIMPGRIMNVRFFPYSGRTMIVAGNKFGNVGFWDVNMNQGEGDGIYLYRPHTGPISGISIQPFSLSKMFTSCYDGFIRLMDIEKEVFHLVYSSDDAIFSLSQRPHDLKSLHFSEGNGGLNVWDERAGKSSSSWILHNDRINSIDFNSLNTNLMATSSTDGTACIWDLRSINGDKPKMLKMVNHKRSVHSAYFSPTGSFLVTTSIDNKVGVLSGVDLVDLSMIHHDNQTGRWISSFRAIWGWDDSYIFIGSMKREVDVISTAQRKIVMTLQSPHMSAIPCRFAAHPFEVGTLAGATSGGQVYMWTSRQEA